MSRSVVKELQAASMHEVTSSGTSARPSCWHHICHHLMYNMMSVSYLHGKRGPIVRTTVNIDDELFEHAKRLTGIEGTDRPGTRELSAP